MCSTKWHNFGQAEELLQRKYSESVSWLSCFRKFENLKISILSAEIDDFENVASFRALLAVVCEENLKTR